MQTFNTTSNFINSRETTVAPNVGDIIKTLGYSTEGGLGGARWKATGNVIAVSQDPLTLNDIKLSDASGNEYELMVEESGIIDLNVLGGTSAGYENIATTAGLTYSQGITSDVSNDIVNIDTTANLIARPNPQVGEAFAVADRASGIFDAKTGLTANGYNILQSSTDGSIQYELRKNPSGVTSAEIGLDSTGVANETTAFNDYVSNYLNNGERFVFSEGTYLISGGLVDTKNNVIIDAEGYALLTHPVEGDTGRTVTQKNILFDTCANCEIRNLDFKGEHINAAGGDNAVQSGVSFLNCTDCTAYNCYAEDVQRGFISQASTNCNFIFCKTKTTYNGFLATSSANFTKWSICEAEDSYYGAQFAPTDASGYGFLADQSTDCEAVSCISTRSGSDCFRSSTSDSSRTRYIGCKSYSPRRNAFSHRDSTSEGCETLNCSAYNVGDASFWNGAAGSYTETSMQARGHYIEAPNVVIDGGQILNLISDESSGSANNMLDIAYIDASNVIMRNVKGYGFVDNTGLDMTNSSDDCEIHNNTFEIQQLTVTAARYVFDMGAGSNHEVTNNKAIGGFDGYLMLGSGYTITGNRAEQSGRHGFNNTSQDSLHDGNIAINPGQIATEFGAGHYFNNTEITCGDNIAIDRQGTTTMYRAVWITGSCAGIMPGRITNRSTVTDLRDDLGGGSYGASIFAYV